MRAFIALSLPSSAQSSLASLQQSLAVSGADVTWVQPQNLHVTMKFLGEITDEQRQTIEALLRRVASGAAPFSLGLEGVGAFPSLAAPRVIWTGIAAGNDVVLLSGVLHRESPDACRALLKKAFESLSEGGLVVVSDVFFDNQAKDSPLFATLFALTMLLSSEHGSAHAKTEMAAWMSDAGFVDIRIQPLPPPMPHTMLLGTRP